MLGVIGNQSAFFQFAPRSPPPRPPVIRALSSLYHPHSKQVSKCLPPRPSICSLLNKCLSNDIVVRIPNQIVSSIKMPKNCLFMLVLNCLVNFKFDVSIHLHCTPASHRKYTSFVMITSQGDRDICKLG